MAGGALSGRRSPRVAVVAEPADGVEGELEGEGAPHVALTVGPPPVFQLSRVCP